MCQLSRQFYASTDHIFSFSTNFPPFSFPLLTKYFPSPIFFLLFLVRFLLLCWPYIFLLIFSLLRILNFKIMILRYMEKTLNNSL